MIQVPKDLERNIERLGGEQGLRWLASLPGLVRDLARLWRIRHVVPSERQSYNFTASCTLEDGRPGFLKIGFPSVENVIAKQAAILRHYGDEIAPEVHGHDPDREALLLEKLEPGTTLFLECGSEPKTAVREAMELLRSLPRTLPDEIEIPRLEEWFAVYEADTSRILPGDILERAKVFIKDLDLKGDTLLHGDFHHGNILRAADGFKVIDPEGAMGSIAYDASVFLNEHFRLYFERPDIEVQIHHAVEAFVAELGLSKGMMIRWAFCQSVQCMCWDAEDFGEYNEIDLSVAEKWLELI